MTAALRTLRPLRPLLIYLFFGMSVAALSASLDLMDTTPPTEDPS